MDLSIQKEKGLYVEGPAKITVTNGIVNIFGKKVVNDSIIVKRGKAISIYAENDSILQITSGIGGKIEEIDGTTIPKDWGTTIEAIKKLEKKIIKVMIIGDIDSGKTTFTTYLANKLIESEIRVAVIDADMGQGELGPPTTINLAIPEKQFCCLSENEAIHSYFVGRTSPAGIQCRVIAGINFLLEKAVNLGAQIILIDTTGWVFGSYARELKLVKFYSFKPELIIALQEQDELEHLLQPVKNFEVIRVSYPEKRRERDRDDRKILRESLFLQYFEGGGEITFYLNKLNTVYTFLGNGGHIQEETYAQLIKILGIAPIYVEDAIDMILIITPEDYQVNQFVLNELEKIFAEKYFLVINEKNYENLMVGLLNGEHEFLGLGIITEINFHGVVPKISLFTPAYNLKDQIKTIQFGCLKVSRSGREIGYTKMWQI